MLLLDQLIQQYGLKVGLVIFFAVLIALAVRGWMTTNDKIKTQRAEMEAIRLKMQQTEVQHRIDMDNAATKQRTEMEAEAERRYSRMQREVKSLYEKRLDDYHTQITTLEGKQITDMGAINELRKRLETMVDELSEQKILLQAEKRAYAELENFNDALQRNNDNLVKHEQELMASEAFLKEQNVNLQRRLDVLEQRISDLEQDNKHKDEQIISLQDKVMGLQTVTTTGENKAVVLPEALPN